MQKMNELKSVKLPEAYVDQMRKLLGEAVFGEYMDSFEQPRWNGLRVNTTKISVEDFLKISPFELEPVPWTVDGFYFAVEDQPTKHPYYYAGLYYIQEPSAMAPVEALNINPGDCCLDLCAAPGGKTLQLAARTGQMGCVVSNDISATRLKAVTRNIEVFGLRNVVVLCETVDRLDKRFNEAFDVVLVDAPCSGEGMFRKEPALIKHWHVKVNEEYSDRQWDIVRTVPELLKEGGEMGYSTCTFSPLENETVVERLLEAHSECKLAPIRHHSYFAHGLSKVHLDNMGMARLYPHRLRGEGHFVSRLVKGEPRSSEGRSFQKTKAPDEFLAFQAQYLNAPLEGRFLLNNGKLYLEPQHNLDFTGLRVQRSGWYLGEIARGKFEPSAAFAMGLKASDFKQVLHFSPDDVRLIKYLKCETLDLRGEEGYHLICVDDFPLGFCRINRGIFKNMYPVAWRLVKEF